MHLGSIADFSWVSRGMLPILRHQCQEVNSFMMLTLNRISNLKVVYIHLPFLSMCFLKDSADSWSHYWAGQLLSAALQVGAAWHNKEEEEEKRHWLPPPRTPFVSPDRQFQSFIKTASHCLSNIYHRVVSINNPLNPHPLHAATLPDCSFHYLNASWKQCGVFL